MYSVVVRSGSALALLVTRVLADHHDAAVATDHLALVTDRLDARVDLHVSPFLLVRLGLLVPVDDPTSGEVVRGELHHDAVLGEDPDVVLAHLAADVGENLVSVGQLDPEHGIRKGLHDGALHLDHAFFLRHVLHNLLTVVFYRSTREPPAPANRSSGPREAAGRASFPRAPARGSYSVRTGVRAAVRRHPTKPRWADAPV